MGIWPMHGYAMCGYAETAKQRHRIENEDFKDLLPIVLRNASARMSSRLLFSRFDAFAERLGLDNFPSPARQMPRMWQRVRRAAVGFRSGLQLSGAQRFAIPSLHEASRSAKPSGTVAKPEAACCCRLMDSGARPRARIETRVQLQSDALPMDRMATARLGTGVRRRHVAHGARSVAVGGNEQRAGRGHARPCRAAVATGKEQVGSLRPIPRIEPFLVRHSDCGPGPQRR